VSFSDSGPLKRRLTTSLPGNGLRRVYGEVDVAGLGGAVTSGMSIL
jgi:hypothetical protein